MSLSRTAIGEVREDCARAGRLHPSSKSVPDGRPNDVRDSAIGGTEMIKMAHQVPQLRFGYFLVPNASTELLQTAQRAEKLGLDYVGVQDHPYQRRFVETWSLLALCCEASAAALAPCDPCAL